MKDLFEVEKIIRKLYKEKLGKNADQISVHEWDFDNKSYVVHIMGRDHEPQLRTEIKEKDIEDYLGKVRAETNIVKSLQNFKSLSSLFLL